MTDDTAPRDPTDLAAADDGACARLLELLGESGAVAVLDALAQQVG